MFKGEANAFVKKWDWGVAEIVVNEGVRGACPGAQKEGGNALKETGSGRQTTTAVILRDKRNAELLGLRGGREESKYARCRASLFKSSGGNKEKIGLDGGWSVGGRAKLLQRVLTGESCNEYWLSSPGRSCLGALVFCMRGKSGGGGLGRKESSEAHRSLGKPRKRVQRSEYQEK